MQLNQPLERIGSAVLTICLVVGAIGNAQAQTGTGTTATGGSNALNPAISLNSLFLAQWQDPANDLDGFKIQELELAMMAVVDPYFLARAFVAFEPEHSGAEAEVAIEEAYIQTTGLPTGWGLRAGRMFIPFGLHNQLHTHQFPFVVPPLAVAAILPGEESTGDVGLDLSYAPPTPWYANVRLFAGDGASAGVFDGESRGMAFGARLENLWDLGEATTMEWGASFLDGPDTSSSRRSFIGMDLRFKWTDPRRTFGHALIWQTEFLLDSPNGRADRAGLYTLALYRVSRRVWIGGGYSWLSRINEATELRGSDHEVLAQVALVPSAFSALRLDLTSVYPHDGERELAARLQFNFTIGSHPAHRY